MSAEQALFDAYQEWHRLAQAVQKAIHKRDWNFLSECQKVVRTIRSSISNLTREARAEWRQRADRAAKEKQLNAVILNLMEQLESNKKLLRATREKGLAAHTARRAALEKTAQNLKRIHSSYAVRRPSVWTSFS
jgi:ribosome recycling factor